MRKKASLNFISKAKKEFSEIQKNKNDKKFLIEKKQESLKELDDKGKKVGIPQASEQARKIIKKRRWTLSDVGGAVKTIAFSGPTVFLDQVGFKRDHRIDDKLKKKAFGLEILVLMICFLFLVLVVLNYFTGGVIFEFEEEDNRYGQSSYEDDEDDEDISQVASRFSRQMKTMTINRLNKMQVEKLLETLENFFIDDQLTKPQREVVRVYPNVVKDAQAILGRYKELGGKW